MFLIARLALVIPELPPLRRAMFRPCWKRRRPVVYRSSASSSFFLADATGSVSGASAASASRHSFTDAEAPGGGLGLLLARAC